MVKAIDAALVCKRLLDPTACNSKCSAGYDFTVSGKRFQKCKNGCFVFFINNENNSYIKSFVENEMRARRQ